MDTAPTVHGRIPDLEIDAQLCLALQTTSSLVTRLYRRLLDPLNLTHPQYLVLLALWESDDALTMGQLSRRTHMDPGGLNPQIKKMEAAGLLERRRDDKDERKVWVRPTPVAWTLRDEVLDVRREVVRRLPLSEQQIVHLRDLLHKMIADMDGPEAVAA
ncbi:MarR family winged helix-turn-helix transcriptional regulator [Brevundimonas sp. SL130]|uniref:MarR family winged helix-turn-helix transcriptional regulator n=1 Tax=Brevundimonas sp. SL130 TaxID=2995143 RepID=UPI00226CF255|nr:MarR family transcriptional regulator [Brevundimonas sp. SL130]WAC60283.1 MarR family transcriptional regulator [Brevundimonas sp. SL130]